jgi:hypothetical protein
MGGLLTWPEEGDESPFRRRLVESEYARSPHGRLRMFEDDGRWVVRLVPALQLAAVPGLLAASRRLHDDVEAVGVPLPPPRLYVMGSRHRDGNPQGFVVARTVTRSEDPGERSLRPSFASETDRLCVALARYYEAHYEAGGRFMPEPPSRRPRPW